MSDDFDVVTDDRPAFSDRGDSVVSEPETVTEKPGPSGFSRTNSPLSGRRRNAVSDESLMVESGMDPIFSTTEAAEFFDRSNQWLYWGLREGVFTDEEGNPLTPEIGRGRRKFTLSIIEDIMKSSYRRGNITPEQLKNILRRIHYARSGLEWRELEGWRYTHLGHNRYKWMRPDQAKWSASTKNWVPRKPTPKKPRRKPTS